MLFPSIAEVYELQILRLNGEEERSAKLYKERGSKRWTYFGPNTMNVTVRNYDLRNGHHEEQIARYTAWDPLYLESNIFELMTADPMQTKNKRLPANECIVVLELAAFLKANNEQEQANRILDAAAVLLERYSHPSSWSRLGTFFGAPGDSPHLFYRAVYHSLRGDKQRALELLREAVDQGFRDRLSLGDARFDWLREEPEFLELMAIVEADMASQLDNIRRMEANGELAAIPELKAK